MKKQFLISFAIFLFILTGTAIVVLYGRGYRFGLDNGKLDFAGTGMLVSTSDPDGAQVFINGHLTTATNNTINLSPGEYNVRIFKDGYFPWEKKIKIKKEVVSKAEALLFPTAPKLENITSVGVGNPALDPSQTRLAYTVSSQTARKNGVYVLDMTGRPVLTLQSSSTQIVDDTVDQFSTALLSWSPDGKEILATISSSLKSPTTYALSASTFNNSPRDVTATLDTTESLWHKEKIEKEEVRQASLKSDLRKIISEDFKIISWSPDETKILYIASRSATLPFVITPRHLGVDTTPEERSIKANSLYVYDIKEDKNFSIENLSPQPTNSDLTDEENKAEQLPLTWFPDSQHLIYVHDKKIDVMEYDGTNSTTLYAGPFVDNYVFPWPNGSKMVILTSLGNADISPNLYTIEIK
ncbi:MAG: PEGA domain-containing protein [Candidatus Levybacteria bacterium]|nr:PEGA domain-containing protein [Candidatus Levybacteria bacterium]